VQGFLGFLLGGGEFELEFVDFLKRCPFSMLQQPLQPLIVLPPILLEQLDPLILPAILLERPINIPQLNLLPLDLGLHRKEHIIFAFNHLGESFLLGPLILVFVFELG
jgi:hypothetical protein